MSRCKRQRLENGGLNLSLVYLPLPGRAEPIRIALELEGLPYNYEVMMCSDFLRQQETLPFGQLPILRVKEDGVTTVIAQSNSILRLVGRLGGGKGGTYPIDPLEAAKVDEVMDAVQDIYALIAPTLKERDHERKLAMRQALVQTSLPKWLGYLERKLKINGTGYFVGNKLTAADLMCNQLINWLTAGVLEGIPANIVDTYMYLRDVPSRVNLHEKVIAYHKARREEAAEATRTVISI